jgi:hypothetical protein
MGSFGQGGRPAGQGVWRWLASQPGLSLPYSCPKWNKEGPPSWTGYSGLSGIQLPDVFRRVLLLLHFSEEQREALKCSHTGGRRNLFLVLSCGYLGSLCDFGKPLCRSLHSGPWSGRRKLGAGNGEWGPGRGREERRERGGAGLPGQALGRRSGRLGLAPGSAQVAHTQTRIPAALDGGPAWRRPGLSQGRSASFRF